MIAIPIINIAYGLLDNSSRGYYMLVMNVDRRVPFVKQFIIAYWMWYPFIIISLIFFCFKSRKVYYKVLFTIILGMIICYIVYFFFQTTVPRPAVYGSDILSDFVRDTYKIDKPFNCLPSIHVLTTYAVMRGSLELPYGQAKSKIFICVIGILIILSTQFVKQHVIMDLVTAVILGEMIYKYIARRLYWS
jgi:hypothetical protein